MIFHALQHFFGSTFYEKRRLGFMISETPYDSREVINYVERDVWLNLFLVGNKLISDLTYSFKNHTRIETSLWNNASHISIIFFQQHSSGELISLLLSMVIYFKSMHKT